MPAINAVWAFFQDYILPIIQDVADILVDVLGIAITALQGLWENVLLPAITKVYDWFNDNILPILQEVSDFISNTIGPALQWFSDSIINPLADAIGTGLKEALQWVREQLEKLKDFLDNFKLPDWLTPGSSSPFVFALFCIRLSSLIIEHHPAASFCNGPGTAAGWNIRPGEFGR